MKKIIIYILTAAMLGATPAYAAEDKPEVDYIIPNVDIKNCNFIGVNQGEIKVIFSNVTEESVLDSIKLSYINAKGKETNVYTVNTLDKTGKIVNLQFGELLEDTEYSLKLEGEVLEIYQTMPKVIIDEDFENWETAEYTVNESLSGTNYERSKFNENAALKGVNMSSADVALNEENGDKYLEFSPNVLKKDITVGVYLPKEHTDGEIVTLMGIKEKNNNNDMLANLAMLYTWRLSSHYYNNNSTYSDLTDFKRDENGFYNVMFDISKRNTRVVTKDNGSVSEQSDCSVTISDLLGDEVIKKSFTDSKGEGGSVLYSSTAVKTYPVEEKELDNVWAISYYKAGYYMQPAVLGTPGIDRSANTMSFYINTDRGGKSGSEWISGIKVYDNITGQDYEIDYSNSYYYSSKKVELKFSDSVDVSLISDYTISFEGLTSADGLEFSDYSCETKLEEKIENCEDFEICVSPTGNDITYGNGEYPVRTFKRAMEIVGKISENSSYNGEVAVKVDGGVHRFQKPINISNLKFRLSIIGENKPVFTTAEEVAENDFVALSGGMEERIPADLNGKIRALNLLRYIPKTLQIPTGGAVKKFGVYKRDEEQPISAYPNGEEYITLSKTDFEKINYYETDESGNQVLSGEYGYDINIPRVANWGKTRVYACGYLTWTWKFSRVYVTVDSENQKVNLQKTTETLKNGDRIKFLNIPEEIDILGEWASENGYLYVYDDDFSDYELSESTKTVFNLKNTDNIKIEGLTFKNIAGTAIEVKECDGLNISGCDFINIGEAAISGDADTEIRNALIENNKLENLGASGIVIYGGDRTTLEESGNVIKNNTFKNIQVYSRTYYPAIKVNGVGNVVSYNTIINSPHMCIGFSGAKNKISNNYIYEFCRETGDSGAIYAGRDFTWQGNEISYNYIENSFFGDVDKDTVRSSFRAGIYMDDRLSGSIIHNNYIKNSSRGIYIGAGSNNKIYDNVTENCGIGIRVGSSGAKKEFEKDDLAVSAKAFTDLYPVYLEEFPEMSNLVNEEEYITYPHNNKVYSNVHIGEGVGIDKNSDELYEGNKKTGSTYPNYSSDLEAFKEIWSVYSNNTASEDLAGILSAKGIDLNNYPNSGAIILRTKDGKETDIISEAAYLEYECLEDLTKEADVYIATYCSEKLISVNSYKPGDKYLISKSDGADRISVMVFDAIDNLKPLAYKIVIK